MAEENSIELIQKRLSDAALGYASMRNPEYARDVGFVLNAKAEAWTQGHNSATEAMQQQMADMTEKYELEVAALKAEIKQLSQGLDQLGEISEVSLTPKPLADDDIGDMKVPAKFPNVMVQKIKGQQRVKSEG